MEVINAWNRTMIDNILFTVYMSKKAHLVHSRFSAQIFIAYTSNNGRSNTQDACSIHPLGSDGAAETHYPDHPPTAPTSVQASEDHSKLKNSLLSKNQRTRRPCCPSLSSVVQSILVTVRNSLSFSTRKDRKEKYHGACIEQCPCIY